MQPEFCSREKLLHYFKRQQNEKPTPNENVLLKQKMSFLKSVDNYRTSGIPEEQYEDLKKLKTKVTEKIS